MVAVSRDRFFEVLYARSAKGEDIMPAITKEPWPYHSTWRNTRTGALFGKSEEAGTPVPATRYFLNDATG